MKVSLCLLGIKIEKPTLKCPYLFIVQTLIPFGRTVKPVLCLVSLHFEQINSLLLGCYCDLAWACRGVKWVLVCSNLLHCCFWLEGAWNWPIRCKGVSYLGLLFILFEVNYLMPQLIGLCLWLACRHAPNILDSCLNTFTVFAIYIISAVLPSLVASDKQLARKSWSPIWTRRWL